MLDSDKYFTPRNIHTVALSANKLRTTLQTNHFQAVTFVSNLPAFIGRGVVTSSRSASAVARFVDRQQHLTFYVNLKLYKVSAIFRCLLKPKYQQMYPTFTK